MNPKEAIRKVEAEFPFKGYMASNYAPYETVAEVAVRHLTPGARVFDLGCGPCDKTAVSAAMGMQCVGVDDLGDN